MTRHRRRYGTGRVAFLSQAEEVRTAIGAGWPQSVWATPARRAASTCTPSTTSAPTPIVTGRTEAQPAGILEAGKRAFSAGGAPCGWDDKGNGAPAGREPEPPNVPSSRAECARLVRHAVAHGDFERARELIDEATILEHLTNKEG